MQASTILDQANQGATVHIRSVKIISSTLAKLLKEIHGGTWSVNIDHTAQYVSISREFSGDGCIQRSQLREVV